MKRVKAACICQTLHFMLKEDIAHASAARLVKEEVEQYKKTLEKNRSQYKIVEETVQQDDSIIVKVIRQYNRNSIGDYLD